MIEDDSVDARISTATRVYERWNSVFRNGNSAGSAPAEKSTDA